MTQETWNAVDDYINDTLVGRDPALDAALEASAEAGLPPIAVSPSQGKLLHLLVLVSGSKRVLEVGTLGGYSTIWLARALPEDGHLLTLEIDPAHAKIAQANIEKAGVGSKVEIRVGPAAESLADLTRGREEQFDFVFIDADKPSTPDYLSNALELTHPGSLIVIDNVVRNGKIAESTTEDAGVQGIRRANEILASDDRVTATAVQTVGSKGYDGFALGLVTSR